MTARGLESLTNVVKGSFFDKENEREETRKKEEEKKKSRRQQLQL